MRDTTKKKNPSEAHEGLSAWRQKFIKNNTIKQE